MKIFFLSFMITTMFFCLLGCTEKLDQGILTFEVTNFSVSKGEGYYPLIDENNNQFGVIYLQVGMVETDNKGVTRLVNNEDYKVTITLNPAVSGENIKVYYNGNLVDLSSYRGGDNQYDYSFTTGSTDHDIRIDGISADLKRKITISLPYSGLQYTVFYKDAADHYYQITSSNCGIEVDYGTDLVIKVEMKIEVYPSWGVNYTKESNVIERASEEEANVDNISIKIFTINVVDHITQIDIVDIQPIQE